MACAGGRGKPSSAAPTKNTFISLSFTIFFFPQSLLPTSQFYSSFANSFLLFKLFLKPDKGFLLSAPKHPSEPLPKPESGICDHNDDQPIILRGDICACTVVHIYQIDLKAHLEDIVL